MRLVWPLLLVLAAAGPRHASDPRRTPPRARPPRDLPHHAFYFTRAVYTGGGWRGGAWATDYPKADRQFLVVVRRLTNLDAYASDHAVRLDDPELRRFPFLYAVEVGYMRLTPQEVAGLRSYLLAGGFLLVDDFWGTAEWANFEAQIRRVLPEYPIVELPTTAPIFHTAYDVKELLQVPSIGNWRCCRRTSERDGYVPHARGIIDEKGRVLVAINWNTDLGDAWEWAEQPDYPPRFSTYAYQMGMNAILYSMTH